MDRTSPRIRPRTPARPPLRLFTTTLWEYPSQHYDSPSGKTMQGSKDYIGATPSWIVWQLLQRYTREGDLIVDPMCGSGTTIDVAADLGRRSAGFDLSPSRPDIQKADARSLPLPDEAADFVFIDPPYSTHVQYSDDPRCIGKLDASGDDDGVEYYEAMEQVLSECHRVLKDRRYFALYVSDSFRKTRGKPGGTFMPIGFELFVGLVQLFKPVDIICVVRHNQKLARGNWNKAAEDGNFFLRGFNYLFIMKKQSEPGVASKDGDRANASPKPSPKPAPKPNAKPAGKHPSGPVRPPSRPQGRPPSR
jgi:DNA modification methylase